MKEKESFIMYHEEKELFEALTDEQAGKLIKGIFKYESGEETGLDNVLNLLFIQIKGHLDRNRKKYEEKCKKNAENGAKGGRPKKTNGSENNQNKSIGFESNPEKPNGFERNPTKPKKADNEYDNEHDNDNEYDSDNDNDSNNNFNLNIKKEKLEKIGQTELLKILRGDENVGSS